MRVRCWAKGAPSLDQDGPPWMDKIVHDDESAHAKLSLTGPADGPYGDPPSQQIRVIFSEQEWPIIKERIDALFRGEDPNRSELYQNPGGSWKLG